MPKAGEVANGDRAILRVEADAALFAVIDGLGHGKDAAEVATTAASLLNTVPLATSTYDIMQLIHSKLSGSRGAAGTVCVLRDRIVEACAVGNVELRSSEVRLPLVFSAGVLGAQVRKFHICEARVVGRARFVLFSDGISSRTPLEDFRRLEARLACEAIFRKHRRSEDDATVLVADVE
jgi:negative regulator of sigma-B (phosphoserine phosphatase)